MTLTHLLSTFSYNRHLALLHAGNYYLDIRIYEVISPSQQEFGICLSGLNELPMEHLFMDEEIGVAYHLVFVAPRTK